MAYAVSHRGNSAASVHETEPTSSPLVGYTSTTARSAMVASTVSYPLAYNCLGMGGDALRKRTPATSEALSDIRHCR